VAGSAVRVACFHVPSVVDGMFFVCQYGCSHRDFEVHPHYRGTLHVLLIAIVVVGFIRLTSGPIFADPSVDSWSDGYHESARQQEEYHFRRYEELRDQRERRPQEGRFGTAERDARDQRRQRQHPRGRRASPRKGNGRGARGDNGDGARHEQAHRRQPASSGTGFGFGMLPGDISYSSGSTFFYFPIASMLLFSFVGNLLMRVFGQRRV